MKQVEYTARVHREDGSLWAEVLDLPGCFASGKTLDELSEALEEAVALYIADRSSSSDDAAGSSSRGSLSVGELRFTLTA